MLLLDQSIICHSVLWTILASLKIMSSNKKGIYLWPKLPDHNISTVCGDIIHGWLLGTKMLPNSPKKDPRSSNLDQTSFGHWLIKDLLHMTQRTHFSSCAEQVRLSRAEQTFPSCLLWQAIMTVQNLVQLVLSLS